MASVATVLAKLDHAIPTTTEQRLVDVVGVGALVLALQFGNDFIVIVAWAMMLAN
jgi:hypothetical protein